MTKENDQLEDNLLMLQRILATKVSESYRNKLGEIVFQLIASALFCGRRRAVASWSFGSSVPGSNPGARFSEAPDTFQACKAIVS